ncbi:MAG: hypothetical protein C4582_11030 [Desulfobacteraceae bacterium]|jgi:succinate dehydrogenase / fumarate reductase membrane anchor subunit|nr:MAG: hypothetical protein C4582_11030 [Desulfobacteraceae bacterium]
MHMHAWTWLLQRISAVILLVALGWHIALLHFSNGGAPLSYNDILTRLKTPALLSLDVLLLIFGLYHACYGLYSVFLDFDSTTKQRVVVLVLLIAIGLGFAGFGVFGLVSIVFSS